MLRLGCCCYICKRWFFVDSQEGLLSSRGGGGPDILAPGLQFLPLALFWATHRVSCSVTSVVVRWAVLRG